MERRHSTAHTTHPVRQDEQTQGVCACVRVCVFNRTGWPLGAGAKGLCELQGLRNIQSTIEEDFRSS